MKFGLKQLLSPTPQQAQKFFNRFFKVTAIIIGILQFYPQIPKHFADVVTVYIAETNAFVYFLTRMFGIDAGQPQSK
jgi:hypothetical protein